MTESFRIAILLNVYTFVTSKDPRYVERSKPDIKTI